MSRYACDLCGTGTYTGTDGTDRYCPDCESLRPIQKIMMGEKVRHQVTDNVGIVEDYDGTLLTVKELPSNQKCEWDMYNAKLV